MLNSLAAYILGGTVEPQSPSDECAGQPQMRFTSVEADDWLLVDKELPSDLEDSLEDSPRARLTDSEGEQRSSPPPVLPTQHAKSHHSHKHGARNARQVESGSKSRTPSQSPSRPNLMDESWFLTPPPCFTSHGPGELVTGPLENLLIEHPSMSVYQHSSRYSMLESLELADEAVLSDDGTAPDVPDERTRNYNSAQQRTARAASITRLQQREELKSGKKVQKERQPLKRGPLERNNKAREVNTRNARRRRADHAQAQRNSRANNNRKCC